MYKTIREELVWEKVINVVNAVKYGEAQQEPDDQKKRKIKRKNNIFMT